MLCPNRSEGGVFRGVVCLTVGTLLTSSLLHSSDLSRYRDFQFGMDLATVGRITQSDPSRAKIIHSRPALLEEIEWRPLGIVSMADPLLESVFSSEYSLSLVRLSYQARFGLVWLTKRTDLAAREAAAAATLIEAKEAPQREADLRKEQAETERTDREKARLANRPNFRP